MFSFGLVIGLIVFIYVLLDLSWRFWTRKLSGVTCPFQVPWLGSALYLEQSPRGFFKQIVDETKKHGGAVLIWMCWRPVIFCSRKDVIESLLRSNVMIKKAYPYDFFHDWLGTGLLTSYDAKWKKRRRVITPSFHFSILNDFMDIFQKHTNTFVSKIKNIADENKIVDVQNIISHATLDVICDTAMGVNVNAQSEESEFVHCTHFIKNQLRHRMFTPWLWPTFLYRLTPDGRRYFENVKVLQQFTTDVINKRIETRKQSNNPDKKNTNAFLDMLLDLYDQGEINIEGIREEVDTFMFEGHDTTAAGLSWILYELGNNIRVHSKLQKEIDASETTESSFVKKIKSTKYLEYVIKEGLRKHPPVGLFSREIEQDENVGGIRVPKGTTIVVNSYNLHRSEEHWSDPNEFEPERFAEEEYGKRNSYIYLPFSAGPRNCIGQKFALLEMKVFLYEVMKYYNITSLQKEDDLNCTFDIIHKSIDGLNIKFSCRTK